MRNHLRKLLFVVLFSAVVFRAYGQSPYLGEIKIFAGNFAPSGWAMCDGSLLQISQNDALFALIGTTFGGDGQSNFALPDLRGRIPIGQGQGSGLSNYILGQTGGVETVTLTVNQLPVHSHSILASLAPGSFVSPSNGVLAQFRGSVPVYSVNSPVDLATNAVANTGGNQPHDNRAPYLAVNYIISLTGIFPSQNKTSPKNGKEIAGVEPLLGQVILVPFNFAPKNWADCNGQLLSIASNTALFSLLGTTYGVNGTVNFALPDLRGRAPVHTGSSSTITEGEMGGEETHTLTVSEMPAHTHVVAGSQTATTANPNGAFLARPADAGMMYSELGSANGSAGTVTTAGGGQPHENRKPYIAMRYIIAMTGIFPSRP